MWNDEPSHVPEERDMLKAVGNDALVAFIIFQAVFFFLDIYIYTKTNRDIARKREYTYFGMLIMIHMIYLIVNSVWTLEEFGVLHLLRQGITVVIVLSLSAVTGCAYSFFLFASEKMRFGPMWKLSFQYLSLLPAALSLVMIILSPWTGLVFSLNERIQIVHGPFYSAMMLAASLYLVVVAFVALYRILTAETSIKRRSSAAVFFSVLVIILFVVIDDMLDHASILPAAIFAVIIVIFINMQESNINSDALTGMNNRRRAVEYLSERLSEISKDSPLYLYMGDLNGFKKINDVYGHLEGDEALVLASNVLKSAVSRFNGFAARYGGDEFLLCWQPPKGEKADPELLIGDISRGMEAVVEEAKKPYQISIALGYTCCTDKKGSVNMYLERADARLYERKKEFYSLLAANSKNTPHGFSM